MERGWLENETYEMRFFLTAVEWLNREVHFQEKVCIEQNIAPSLRKD